MKSKCETCNKLLFCSQKFKKEYKNIVEEYMERSVCGIPNEKDEYDYWYYETESKYNVDIILNTIDSLKCEILNDFVHENMDMGFSEDYIEKLFNGMKE